MFPNLFKRKDMLAENQETRCDANCASSLVFEKTYANLDCALCLCSGLEIIASNGACDELLGASGTGLTGKLVSSFLPDYAAAETVFDTPGQPQIVELRTNNGPSTAKLTAQPWADHQQMWLLQWDDLGEVTRLETELKHAREFDPATGALLPAAFIRQLDLRLTEMKRHHETGILCQVAVELTGNTVETRNDLICDLIGKVRDEFGETTLISREDSGTLNLFCGTCGIPNEEHYVLRQLHRICRQADTRLSVGGCVFPKHGTGLEQLFKCLEMTKRPYSHDLEPVLFAPEMAQEKQRLCRLADDIEAAMEANEVTAYFQPVVRSTDGSIKGFEALVRWIHPELGYVIPPDIVAIATERGLLHRLTAHIMNLTMTQIKKWPESVQFAVNVVPSQLTGDLVDLVRQTVREANIDPGRFEIEVTEDALISDFEFSAKIFGRLRAIGVAVAMDDFGSGYTSVGNLGKLDFTKIKIDKIISDGLPHDKRSVAIVRSLMFMAKELDLDITIEGIESEEQLELLREFDCGIQGYVFSPAVPASALAEMNRFLSPKTFEAPSPPPRKKTATSAAN